jgi:hypothetical protein
MRKVSAQHRPTSSPSRALGAHHVAIYGGGKILQTPRTDENVRFGTISEFAGQTMTVRRLG